MSPLVAVWLDRALHFSTGATEQKAVNLRVNPHVILSTGCNLWDRGIDVVLEGEAIQTTDDTTLERLVDAWRRKWDGRWQFEAREGCFHHEGWRRRLVFTVAPTKVLAFGKGTIHPYQPPLLIGGIGQMDGSTIAHPPWGIHPERVRRSSRPLAAVATEQNRL